MCYNEARHKTEVGTTKRSKVRTVDFCNTLAAILRAAKTKQHKNCFCYGELYHPNYYKEGRKKGRTYYVGLQPAKDRRNLREREISFVCLRVDGAYEAPSTVGIMCRAAAKKKVKSLGDFHFHTLRHTYMSNLLSGGARLKDV